ncbi:MAG TPA: PTS sugar transporter subunit IIB [Ktedonobacteraceae bacterium]|jgi:mannose/fructose/N-acetylgalactosamine-specific phosphotransferase system component IIB|nr:PTS sugar transporter subunit IIB [Ktedonobacteraceae bacterium]
MSEVVLNRVDDRLIHGQVMTGWLGARRANVIWIADDGVASNPMMLDIFRFAAPSGIKIEAFTIERIAEKLSRISDGHDRIILLAKVPRTFLRLLEKGYRPSDINYGAMAHRANSRNVAPNCDLSPDEIADSEMLHQQGIRIWIQLVPFGSQKPIEWVTARKKAGLK